MYILAALHGRLAATARHLSPSKAPVRRQIGATLSSNGRSVAETRRAPAHASSSARRG